MPYWKALLPTLLYCSIHCFEARATDRIKCEPLSSLEARIEEELCQSIAEAAETCFAKLNFETAKLQNKVLQNPKKKLDRERQDLSRQYTEGIATLNNYLPFLQSRGCPAQRAAVEVVIAELKKDVRQIKLNFMK